MSKNRLPALGVRVVCLALAAAFAEAHATPYTLEAGSAFEEGCQGGCDCPIRYGSLAGTFDVTPEGSDGDFDIYTVSGVSWSALPGPSVRGSGRLRIRRDSPMVQQLELDLSLDGAAAVRFDSGLVPLDPADPRIVVDVAMNGFYCFDRVFRLQAATTGLPICSGRVCSGSWGQIKSAHR